MFGLVSEKKFKELERKYVKSQARVSSLEGLEKINSQLKSHNLTLQAEINDIKKKLRSQTEADLFFECAKIQKKLMEGEKVENLQSNIERRLAYEASLQQMANQTAIPRNSLLQALGCGGWLGALGR